MFNRKIGTISKTIHTPYEGMFGLGGGTPTYVKEVTGTRYIDLTNAVANKLLELKAYGGIEQRNLPSGYTQVEYIQSDGAAWLDTGFIANGGMIFDGKVMPVNKDNMTIGSITDTGQTSQADLTRNLITYVANNNVYTPQKLNKYMTNYADAGTSPVVIHLDTTGTNFYCTINGNEVINDTTGTLTNQTTTVKLGYSDYSGTSRAGRYYPLQFRNSNGDLVRDLIPAKNSSNVVSMYDLVSKTFLPVQGTGTFTAGANAIPSSSAPMDIVCNNGALKVNKNLYSTEYHDKALSQSDGVTTSTNTGVNVSGMVDCSTIKSFKITTISQQGSFRIFKYGTDNTFINANSTGNIGDIVTFGDNVGFFRIQYNYTSASVDTEDILIYNSAYSLNGIYTDGTTETIEDAIGNTATAEMLLKVGDYIDEQSILDGAITRNCKIYVFNGTESWYTWSTLGYFCDFTNAGAKSSVKVLSTVSNNWNFTSANRLLCNISQATFPTLEDWTDYLKAQYNAGTPVIMVYALATATTESVAGQTMNIQTGTNTIEITQASIDNLGLYAKYESSQQ